MLGIDLFAGAGGMSLGAKLAGIDVRLAVELNVAASSTFRRNHPSTMLICGNITDIDRLDVGPRDQEVVLFGGPPCQGFSVSNQRTRHSSNPRNWLFLHFLRLVESTEPDWVVFENVAGILQTEGGLFAKAFDARLRGLGYLVASGVLNAAKFGCPQRRSRYFVVAARNYQPKLPDLDATDVPSLWDAIADLPILENGASKDVLPYSAPPISSYASKLRGVLQDCTGHLVSRNADNIVARYAHVREGRNWRDVPGMVRDGYDDRRRYHSGIYRRLEKDRPSVVIGNFRKNMLIHPTQDRGLSVREAARLQSFPDTYTFQGSIGLQQQQVGNAVPPMLAKAVFEQIRTTTGSIREANNIVGRREPWIAA